MKIISKSDERLLKFICRYDLLYFFPILEQEKQVLENVYCMVVIWDHLLVLIVDK